MSLSGSQLERVTQALRSAYTRDELRAVLRVCMEEDFDDLVADKGFAAQVFDLVQWAERYGRVEQLVRCAATHNPGKQELQILVDQMQQSASRPTTAVSSLDSSRPAREIGLTGQSMDDLLLVAAQATVGGARSVDLARLLQASMQLGITSTPAPRFDDLFDIVRYPEELYPSIFRGDPGRLIAPYHVPHVAGRVGVEDVQADLRTRLQTGSSAGALLVLSPAGLGKTREVAELALQMCIEGWTICIAKGESDALMNPTADFPEELRSHRLLFVLDDLHKRVVNVTQDNKSYIDRLNAFLDFISRFLLPGELYVIATARNEPQYQSQLDLRSGHSLWRRFDLYELPGFTHAGLVSVLISLAQQAQVELDPLEAERLIADSDLRLRTIVENVRRCQWQQQPLTHQSWKQAQGQSWAMLFQEAQNRWQDVLYVYHSLYMIRAAGLPTRTDYVVKLGNFLAGSDVRPAAENLVNMGILGMHGDRLDAFGDEQLVDSLRNEHSQPPKLESHWDDIIKAFCGVAVTHPDWVEDLHVLAFALLMTTSTDKARAVANEAIKLDPRRAEGYYLRGLAYYDADDFVAAEADFSTAIEYDVDKSALFHYWRGLSLYYQAEDEEAIAEFTAAIDRDKETPEYLYWRALSQHALCQYALADADLTAAIAADTSTSPVYPYQRGRTRMEMMNFPDALVDFNTAIEHDGGETAFLFYDRGQAYFAQQLWAEAEQDFRKAIELDPDNVPYYYALGHAHYGLEHYADAEADFECAIERAETVDPELYFWRGTIRFVEGKFDLAEADLTIAVEHSAVPESLFFYRRGRARYYLDKLAEAEADFSSALEHDTEKTSRYHFWRGMTHYYRQRYAEAEADFAAAIQMESDPEAEYCYRCGRARYELQKLAEAEADFSAAIEKSAVSEPAYFYWRATARYDLGALATAEADFTMAIELAHDADPQLYFWRGMARYYQQKYPEAETDFTRAVELDPEGDPLFYFRRGRARYRQNNVVEAAADFSTAIRHSAVLVPVYYYWRALSSYDQGQFEVAEANLTIAIEHDAHEEPTFYFWRGMARYYQRRYGDAEADFTFALARAEEPDLVLYYRRGRARTYQAKYKDAEADFTAAMEQSISADPTLAFWRGIVRFEQADYAGADADFSSAIAGAPQFDPIDSYWRGRARFKLGDYAQAEDDFAAAIKAEEFSDPTAYYWRGMARAEQSKLAEAEADLTAAIEQGVDGAEVYCARSWLYLQAGRNEQARADCAEISLRAHHDPDSYHAWGDWRLAEGDLPGALAQFQAAHAAAPESNWHRFCWAYGLLLSDQLLEGGEALGVSTAQAADREARRMLRWLEFWAARRPEHAPSSRIADLLAQARRDLKSDFA